MDSGSEFRTANSLEPLLSEHKHWPATKQIITIGVTYDLDKMSEENRLDDLKHMMARGNHKSASDPINEPTLLKNYEKEVKYGWMLPVTT